MSNIYNVHFSIQHVRLLSMKALTSPLQKIKIINNLSLETAYIGHGI